MPKILVAPFAAKLRTGHPNAKNPSIYWWQIIVQKLNNLGYDIIQIGGLGEQRIVGVSQLIINQPLGKLRELVGECVVWISVDSFLPHMCWAYNLKTGIVAWSQSDPIIFGHDRNINLLKSRDYLRPLQYQDWISATYNEDAFVTPDQVIEAVLNHVSKSTRSSDGRRFVPRGLSVAQESAT